MLFYESFFSHMSINKKRKEKKKQRNINIDLAVLPSYDTSLSWQGELNRVSIRFFILLIQLLHGLCTVFPHLSCDIMWCDIVTSYFMWLWLCDTCDMTLSYTPFYVVSPREKRKKKKKYT